MMPCHPDLTGCNDHTTSQLPGALLLRRSTVRKVLSRRTLLRGARRVKHRAHCGPRLVHAGRNILHHVAKTGACLHFAKISE